MTAERRTQIALVVFVLDVLVCGLWAYGGVRSVLRLVGDYAGGGIAGVSGGAFDLVVTVAGPLVTIVLARASGSRLAKWWRNAHLVATLALIIVPMAMLTVYVLLISNAVFLPVQVFFVLGAVAIWFASPRTPPLTPGS